MRCLAKLYMIDWTEKLKKLLKEVTANTEVPGIDLNGKFVKVFVDDENSIHVATPPGAVYNKTEKRIVISEEQQLTDSDRPADRRTADIITEIRFKLTSSILCNLLFLAMLNSFTKE